MLMATWDGAGNFPPERALVHALATRGHALLVLGHLSQRDAVEADGVTFLPLTGALNSADRDHERSVFQDVMMGEGLGVRSHRRHRRGAIPICCWSTAP